MQEQYVAPELKLAGGTGEVVLGSLAVEGDIRDQYVAVEMEFETD